MTDVEFAAGLDRERLLELAKSADAQYAAWRSDSASILLNDHDCAQLAALCRVVAGAENWLRSTAGDNPQAGGYARFIAASFSDGSRIEAVNDRYGTVHYVLVSDTLTGALALAAVVKP